jgi:hypothetical protein
MKPITWLMALRRVIIISKPSSTTAKASARSSRASASAPAVTGSMTRIDSADQRRAGQHRPDRRRPPLPRAVNAELPHHAVQRGRDDDALDASAMPAVT